MKIIKYILHFLFIVILVGITGKTFLPFNNSGLILFFGMMGYLIGAILYIVLALIHKKHRVEASMLGISFLLSIGVFFTAMRWPFGGPLTVVGSPTMLMLSIGLLGYLLAHDRKVPLGVLYVATGLSSLFFCFRIMFWPGTTPLFIAAIIGILVASVVLYLKKQKMTSAVIVLFILNGCIFVTSFASESRLYRYKHLNTIHSEINLPENYYTYAWMLYKEGNIEEAKVNLQLAIQEAKNPNNQRADEFIDSPEATIQRYERAMNLLNTSNWNEKEMPANLY